MRLINTENLRIKKQYAVWIYSMRIVFIQEIPRPSRVRLQTAPVVAVGATAHGGGTRVGFPWGWFELFRRIFRATYKQAANMYAGGAEFSMFDPRNFVFWRGDRLRNGHTMVQWCGQLQPKG
jgi:hypothetical protein